MDERTPLPFGTFHPTLWSDSLFCNKEVETPKSTLKHQPVSLSIAAPWFYNGPRKLKYENFICRHYINRRIIIPQRWFILVVQYSVNNYLFSHLKKKKQVQRFSYMQQCIKNAWNQCILSNLMNTLVSFEIK